MTTRSTLIAAGAVVLGVAGGGAIALGTGEDDSAEQVSGAGADKAAAAALEITGGGRANWPSSTPRAAPPGRSR